MMENFINPPAIPTDSKALRVLGLTAFVLATHGQVLERFSFLTLERDFLWIWKWTEEVTSHISTFSLKYSLVCVVWGSLWESVGYEDFQQGWERLGSGIKPWWWRKSKMLRPNQLITELELLYSVFSVTVLSEACHCCHHQVQMRISRWILIFWTPGIISVRILADKSCFRRKMEKLICVLESAKEKEHSLDYFDY